MKPAPVHANNFKGHYYGLVAGFVETGETLEQAVQSNGRNWLDNKELTVFWLTTMALPLRADGWFFHADYASGEIHLQRSELGAGGWFSKDHLPEF